MILYRAIVWALLLFGILTPSFAFAQFQISEVCSSNLDSHRDSYGDSPDWLELVNSSGQAESLSGWRISDKADWEGAWELPDTNILSKGHLLINASGRGQNGSNAILMKGENWGYLDWVREEMTPYAYIKTEGDFRFQTEVRWYNDIGKWGNVGISYRQELSPSSRFISLSQMKKPGGPGRGNFNIFYRDTLDRNPFHDIDVQYHYDPMEFKLAIEKSGDSLWIEINDQLDRVLFKGSYPNPKHPAFTGNTWDSGYVGLYLSQNLTGSDEGIIEGPAFASFENYLLNGDTLQWSDFSIIDFTLDKKNEIYKDNEIHTDFSVSSAGETIYLWSPDGVLRDSLILPKLYADESFGRAAGSSAFSEGKLLAKPTPSEPNGEQMAGRVEEFKADMLGGIYPDGLRITMESGDNDAEYRYTFNGSMPTEESALFNGYLDINQNTALRIKGFRDGYLASKEYVASYIVEEDPSLPVFTILADSMDLYAEYGGLLTDLSKRDNKKTGYFEDLGRNRIWKVDLELQGHLSREFPQKSIETKGRSVLNSEYLNEDFFDDNYTKHTDLVLKNHGSSWQWVLFSNHLAHLFSQDLSLLTHKFLPSYSYINGNFYGLVTLNDRINRARLAEIYDIPEKSINLFEDSLRNTKGEEIAFIQKFEEIYTLDTKNADINDIDNLINVNNAIDYYLSNFHLNNVDWPYKNYSFWMSEDYYDNRMEFILSDMDWILSIRYSESHHSKFGEIETDQHIMILLNHLLQNDEFRYGFINRYCDLLHTSFRKERLLGLIDSLADIYRPHIPRHQERWPDSALNWDEEIEKMRTFAEGRNYWVYHHMKEYFQLSGINHVKLATSHPGNSYIEFSGLTHTALPRNLKYMNDTPIHLKAIASEGYRFVRWEPEWIGDKAETEVVLTGDSTEITAIFERIDENGFLSPVISEIMYAAPQDNDCGDWIEIFNPNNEDLDISGWSITDSREKDALVFPEETVIKAKESIVLIEDQDAFFNTYGTIDIDFYSPLSFGMSRQGDSLLLINPDGAIMDSLFYGVGGDWPDANRNGKSIELINWNLDNSLGVNWITSFDSMGSPGANPWKSYKQESKGNSSISIPRLSITSSQFEFESINIISGNRSDYSLVSTQGRVVMTILDGKVDFSGLAPGIYLLIQKTENKAVAIISWQG